MIDILLINPRETGGFFERMPPLGLAYCAACLEQHDFSVRIVDFEVENKSLKYWLDIFQPRYLGISGTTHTRFESFRLADEAKAYNRGIVTIYGGVHATFTASDTVKHIKSIDYVVRGEGEQTLSQLIKTLDRKGNLAKIRGITYRTHHGIVENPSAERIEQLDNLPRPSYHLLGMDKYALDMEFISKRGISVITSRGCHARCSFCSASKMYNHRLTVHSAQRVVDEIEFLFEKYGFEGVKVFDSTLTMRKDHIVSFCDEIIGRNLRFPWECEIRVGTVDQDILEKMKDAGCYYVSFGIESASQRVLDLMRKGFTVRQAECLLDVCYKVGVRTKVFFSFGHIGETMNDVEKTFLFIERHKEKITTVASGAGVRIYPGTYIEEYARDHGLLTNSFEWSKPFTDKRLEMILQTGCVPILIQPQLGMRELEDIAIRIYRRRFSGWLGFRLGLRKIADKNKIKKLISLLRLRLKRFFNRSIKKS